MDNYIYEFKNHFEIASSGQKVKAENIVFQAPNNKVLKYVTVLDQELNQAVLAMSEKASNVPVDAEKKDAEVTGKEIFMMLSAGGGKLPACFEGLKQISMRQGKINDQSLVTDHIFGEMSYNDTKELLGGYINHFLYSSLAD